MKRVLTLTILIIVAKHCFSQQTKDATGKYLDTFYVFVENGKNVITWISKTETDVSWYLLERSTDGKEYTSASLYDSGSLHKRAYQFKDGPNPGTIRSYRIRILDNKGNILDTQYIYIKQTKTEDLPVELYAKIPYKIRDFLLSR